MVVGSALFLLVGVFDLVTPSLIYRFRAGSWLLRLTIARVRSAETLGALKPPGPTTTAAYAPPPTIVRFPAWLACENAIRRSRATRLRVLIVLTRVLPFDF